MVSEVIGEVGGGQMQSMYTKAYSTGFSNSVTSVQAGTSSQDSGKLSLFNIMRHLLSGSIFNEN